jgi:hypothetical protein
MGISADTYGLFNTLYDKPYHRWSVYFIGLFIGILFIEMKIFNKTNKITLINHNIIHKS